ncbi:uncharacterized protein LOC144129505 [Amblyomma americanum]
MRRPSAEKRQAGAVVQPTQLQQNAAAGLATSWGTAPSAQAAGPAVPPVTAISATPPAAPLEGADFIYGLPGCIYPPQWHFLPPARNVGWNAPPPENFLALPPSQFGATFPAALAPTLPRSELPAPAGITAAAPCDTLPRPQLPAPAPLIGTAPNGQLPRPQLTCLAPVAAAAASHATLPRPQPARLADAAAVAPRRRKRAKETAARYKATRITHRKLRPTTALTKMRCYAADPSHFLTCKWTLRF